MDGPESVFKKDTKHNAETQNSHEIQKETHHYKDTKLLQRHKTMAERQVRTKDFKMAQKR